jgi:hypothetical protein
MPEGMQRAGKHKGIREKREDAKVIFERLISPKKEEGDQILQITMFNITFN